MGGKPTKIHTLILILFLLTLIVLYGKYMNYATQTFTIQITYHNQSNLTIDYTTHTTGTHTLTSAGHLYRSETLPPHHYSNLTIYGTGDTYTLHLAIYNNQHIQQNLNPDGTFNPQHALKTFSYTKNIHAAGDTHTYHITIHDKDNITANEL